MTSQVRATYVRNALLSSKSGDVFTDFLTQSGRELWPIITWAATIVAGAGVKGKDFIKPNQCTCFNFKVAFGNEGVNEQKSED